ncbi:hypothetical protein MKX03_029298 [Papaver bracteatum]|nr:hypothetical protein MKX03_029298 [Papaver bracteatum]
MAGVRWKLNLGSYFSSAQLEKLNEVPASSSKACGTQTKLDAPDDILQILHTYFSWETIEDINITNYILFPTIDNVEHYYHRVLWERRDDDISADMEKLKKLSGILREEYDRCTEVCYANDKKAAQPYYELVEQLPSIKNDPSYKDLTTGSERFFIKQVLKKVHQKGQIQTPQQPLCSHLEVLREKLQHIDKDEFTKAGMRMASVEHLLWRVNGLIGVLELVEKKSRYLKMVKEREVVAHKESCTSGSTA